MRAQIRHLEADGRERVLSIAGIRVGVQTEDGPCEICGGPTHVQKTQEHRVVTLEHGSFRAHERVRVCSARCRRPEGGWVIRRSESLSRKVPQGSVYGYDLEVAVGLQRFVHHRQREEIRTTLEKEHGLRLSSGEISHLTSRFVEHIEALHQIRAPKLREALEGDGGYPMHIDATGEDGRGTLFMAYAGSRHWVLGSWKVATERAELILPCLRQTVDLFGPPVGIMRDLGKAVTLAALSLVQERGIRIPILSCHFHFLQDVGKDLLSEGYGELRDLIRRFRIRPSLRALARDLGRRLGSEIVDLRGQVAEWAETEHPLPEGPEGLAAVRAFAQWTLDYTSEARHGFPWDLPYLVFYQRCFQVRRAADLYLSRAPDEAHLMGALHRLARILDPVVAEVPFERIARSLSSRASLFEELRKTLRISPGGESSKALLTAEQAASEIQDIEAAVGVLTQSLCRRRPQRGPAQDTRQAIDLILTHLDRHGESLWGHVLPRPDILGGGIRVLDRTNQIQESFWHRLKHGERRRSGRKVLTFDFEGLPPAAALAQNLEREDYVSILCGSLDKLPLAFAELDQARRRQNLAPASGEISPGSPGSEPEADVEDMATASLPRDDRKLVRSSSLGDRIRTAARCRAPRHVAR